jgi:hypothetical protein
MTDSLALQCLSNTELMALVGEFEPIADIEGRDAVACWGRWWAWRVASELADRIDVDREPQPEIGGLSDLSPAELTALSMYFGSELPILADTLGSPNLAAWCRTLGDWMMRELARQDTEAAKSRARLEAYIAEQRRHRPHGTPGDTRGLPKWSEISGPPDDG